jgi:hypothetical protein
MQKEDKCIGLIGGLFGHKFEGRFDEDVDNNKPQQGDWVVSQIPEDILEEALMQGENLADIIEAMGGGKSKTTYIHDVCVRCGKIIKREP